MNENLYSNYTTVNPKHLQKLHVKFGHFFVSALPIASETPETSGETSPGEHSIPNKADTLKKLRTPTYKLFGEKSPNLKWQSRFMLTVFWFQSKNAQPIPTSVRSLMKFYSLASLGGPFQKMNVMIFRLKVGVVTKQGSFPCLYCDSQSLSHHF